MIVIKRNNTKEEFDSSKIKNSIEKVYNILDIEIPTEDINDLVEEISSNITHSFNEISSNQIAKMVENGLIWLEDNDVAREYISYRAKQALLNEQKQKLDFNTIINTENNDITRENANMNSDTPAGMMMKFASDVTKSFTVNNLLSKESKNAYLDNYIHIHDMDYYPTRSLTCLQSPIDKILKNGFKAGHGESRAAKRIMTAATLAAISMETTQNEQHGGQAIPAFDFYMAPYVRMTFIEELKELEKYDNKDYSNLYNIEIDDYILNENINTPLQHAINRTVKHTHQAMESFVHNMNEIHSRGGNQVVFSSINYGTDTSAEGRCVMRELLLSTEKGVGNGATAIFPIQIFKVKKNVNYEQGDRNYDLFQLSCRVTAKRFFPNFLNLDATFNQNEAWNANDPNRYMHEIATMGCLHKDEVISYKYNKKIFVATFKEFWNRMKRIFNVRNSYEEGYKYGQFIDLKDVEIYSNGTFVQCLRLIKNPNTKGWLNIKLTGGRILKTTLDHPWLLSNDKVVYAKDLKIGDKIPLEKYQDGIYPADIHKLSYKKLNDMYNKGLQFDKNNQVLDDYIYNSEYSCAITFFLGLIQNHKAENTFVYSSKNKSIILKLLLLCNYLNYDAYIYDIYNNDELKYFICCYLDRRQNDESIGLVREISFEPTLENEFSYDVTTESELFSVSGVITHNCRTRVFEDKFGPKQSVGRGNLSFTTINLPKLAIETSIEDGYLVKTDNGYEIKENNNQELRISKFFLKIKKYCEIVAKQLDERFQFQAEAFAYQFPLLMNGLWNGSEKLKPTDKIKDVLNTGTLGIGFIGLAEALIALTGKHHGESEESQKIGLETIELMRKYANDASEKYNHNYSILATPAEGLSGKFTKIDKKTFGIIKGVTDKDYYTNSNHVPVYYECTAKHKIEVEAPYHEKTRGGHIFYVEIDGDATRNPEAIEDIVKLALKENVGYMSVNHFQQRCPNCNYESNDTNIKFCPKCGEKLDILQRITGYLVGTTNRWNNGKLAELKDRVQHKL